jgi:YD repeat-containing protein
MRRSIAFVLLLGLFGQSSGAAWAGSAGAVPSRSDFAALFYSLRLAVVSSRLYADVTGSGDHYAAAHAPRPIVQRRLRAIDAAALMRSRHAFLPREREGTPERLALPSREDLFPHHRILDPRAMRRSSAFRGSSGFTNTRQNTTTSSVQEPLQVLGSQTSAGSLKTGRRSRQQGGVKPMTASNPATGIEPWWTYEERAIPGIGKAMLNVGSGNFIVSAMDVDVPEQGIDLAFQRVYNSQSLHDVSGDDGGDPAIFGNGWTNTVDANIVYAAPPYNTITVYDIDGAGCTYTANGDGTWQPCTGEYATLAPVTNSGYCQYEWTKPNGTAYIFENDNGLHIGNCGSSTAFAGHLVEIVGRNVNNAITFNYSYDSSGIKNSEHVTKIVANHSDGDSLVLTFGIVPGTSYNELKTTKRPDGAYLDYWYGQNGNLLEVDKPGNNSATGIPNSPNSGNPIQPGDVPETYSYAMGIMNEACGPRCTVSTWRNNQGNPTDGSALLFAVTGTGSASQLTSWIVWGVMNFTPGSPDPTGTVLQRGVPTNANAFYTAYFDYGQGPYCSQDVAGRTTMCDSDGHATAWTTDSAYRVSTRQMWPNNSPAIVTLQGWDSNNNLVSSTDPNQYTTQYGYDASGSGNMVEMQQPQVTDVPGNPSPLSYYSYDNYHNVTSYCDPVYNQTHQNSWVSSPNNNLCPGTNHTTILGYTQTTAEPFGCLKSITKPSGYATSISYGNSTDQCGVGLPMTVKAAQAIENYDNNSSRQPMQNFYYDGQGDLSGYDKGNGGDGNPQDSWSLSYNGQHLNIERTENEPTIQGAIINSYTCYYLDGSVYYTETPWQHDTDGNQSCPTRIQLENGGLTAPTNATWYSYDTDGDQVQMVDHKGGATGSMGTTTKYYDGLDRLVEVIEPQDTRLFPNGNQTYDCYKSNPWMTRYIYDLSGLGGGAGLNIGGVTGVAAYGGLYKTMEYVPNVATVTACPTGTSFQWTDVRGSTFDGVDRVLNKYELGFGTDPKTINIYDGTNEAGLLTESKNTPSSGSHQTVNYIYDQVARVQEMDFGGVGPPEDNRTYTFDANGHTLTSTTPTLGTLSYTYDLDGNITSESDPSIENNASTVSYTNYPDGLREYLYITSSNGPINQPNQPILSYGYRQDGRLEQQYANWSQSQGTFTWTYTPGGRELTETDPFTGTRIPTIYYPPNNQQEVSGHTILVAKQYQYGKYGRVNTLTYPETYQADNMVYDADDELSGMTVSTENNDGSVTDDQLQYNYILSDRGELLSELSCQTNCTGIDYPQSANGTLVDPYAHAQKTNPAETWQALSGATMSNTGRAGSLGGATNNYTYDESGRQITDSFTPPQGSLYPQTVPYARTYDAEDQLIAAPTGPACNPNNTTVSCFADATLSWGPDGKLRGVAQIHPTGGGLPQSQSSDLHWDGATLLFTTTKPYGASAQTTLYIGKAASTDGSGGYLVADRDQNGIEEAWHTGTNYSAWNNFSFSIVGSGRFGVSAGEGINWGSCWSANQYFTCPVVMPPNGTDGLLIDFSRADGYSFGTFAIQGVRAYDSTSQQWLTPDAYAGNVHDPVSQKPFVWNNNNPVEYSDPSGYCPGGAWFLTGPLITGVWCAVDDARTLSDSHASSSARLNAALNLSGLVIPEAVVGEIAERLVLRAGVGPAKAALSTLESGGVKGIERAIKTYTERIAEHEAKIKDAISKGGYTSSMEREVRNFTANRDALQELQKAVNEYEYELAPGGHVETLDEIYQQDLNIPPPPTH